MQPLIVTVAILFARGHQPIEELHFPNPLANLGELRSYRVHSHSFPFVNESAKDLEILAVEPSCGCLVPRLERRLFRPGEKGTLLLEAKPSSQPEGPHAWFARVRYRCGEQVQETSVQIKAVLRHEVSVQPPVLALYGAGEIEHEVVLTDHRKAVLKVTNVRVTSNLLQARLVSADRGTNRIVLQAGKIPPGRHDEVLTIQTDDPVYQEFRIRVTLVGERCKISAVPERITVRVESGRPLPATLVRLRPADDRRLEIEKVIAGDEVLTCTWAAGPGNDATLKVRVDAARLGERDLDTTIRVLLRAPTEFVVIPVRTIRQ